MKSEPNAGPNAVVSFDALLTLALQEQTRRELAALPDAEALQTLYPDTAGWDKRLRRALAERRKAARSAPRVRWMPLRRLVTVAAVLVLVLAGALATSAEVRYAVRHAVLQWTDIDLRLTYDTEGTPADLTLPQGYADHYVPEGFVLDEGNSYTTEYDFFHKYLGEIDGVECTYSVICYAIQAQGQVDTFDSEHTVYETVEVNGAEATLGTSTNYDGGISYYLFWERDGIHHTIQGDVPRDMILEIAEEIQ